MVAIHGRPATSRHQHRLGPHQPEAAGAHVDHQKTGQPFAICGRDHRDGAVFLKLFDRAAQNLFHQPVDDLDAGEVTLVHGAVGGLSGKGLLMQRAVAVAVEETADLIFKLVDAFNGGLAQPPGHVLIRQPFAAIDGVHEMPFDRIAAAKRHIVAALDHAGAAAFADQPFDRHGDPCAFRRTLLGMKRGKQSGTA